MKRLLSLLTVAAGIAAVPTTTQASFSDSLCGFEDCGIYIHAKGGADWHREVEFGPTKRDFHLGGFGGGSIGYYFDQFRLEAECTYKKSDLESSTFPGATSNIANGFNRNIALMFNGFYDYEFSTDFFLSLGTGIGVTFHKLEATILAGAPVAGTSPTSKSKAYFAWQLMPGMMYKVSDGVFITAGYRLFLTGKIENATGTTSSKQVPIIHSAEAGLLFKL